MRNPVPGRFLAGALAAAWLLGSQAALATWPQQIGGSFVDLAHDAVVDAAGNTYVTGEFSGTITLGETPLAAEGLSDVFVAKISPQGDVVWATSAGGSSVDRGLAIVVDVAGRTYITGTFSGEVTFSNQTAGDVELPGSGCASPGVGEVCAAGDPFGDLFVAKLDTDGTWLWARQAGFAGLADAVTAIDLLPGDAGASPPAPDGVVIAGSSRCPVFFAEDGTGEEVAACDPDQTVLVAKIDVSGNWLWSRTRGIAEITDLDVDQGERDVLVTGSFSANTDLNDDVSLTYTIPASSPSYTVEFWYKYRTDGDESFICNSDTSVFVEMCSDLPGSSCQTVLDTSGSSRSYTRVTRSVPEVFAGGGLFLRWSVDAPADSTFTNCYYQSSFYVDDFKVTSDTGKTLLDEDFSNLPPDPAGWVRTGEEGGGPSNSGNAHSSPKALWMRSVDDPSGIDSAPLPLPDARPNSFLAKLVDTAAVDPTWAWAERAPADTIVDHLLADAGTLFATGTVFGLSSFATDPATELDPADDPESFAARLDASSDLGPTWEWVEAQGAGVLKGLAADPSGSDHFYVAGQAGSTGVLNEPFAGSPIPILDNQTITSDINVGAPGVVLSVSVSVTITHTYRGDLSVELISPGTTTVVLHDRSGGGADNLLRTYPVPNLPDGPGSMSDFVDEAVAGDWTLRVTDHENNDQGTLVEWSLQIETCEAVGACVVGVPDLFVRKLETADGDTTWTAEASATGDRGVAGVGAALVGPVGSAVQKVFLAGHFEQPATFADATLFTRGVTDAFVAQLDDATQEWFTAVFTDVLVGTVVDPPSDADLGDPALSLPDIVIEGGGDPTEHFLWVATSPTPRLYALWPAKAELRWKVNLDPTSEARTDPQFIDVRFPQGFCDREGVTPGEPCRQAHIAGAPVEIDPAGNPISFQRVHIGPTGAIHGEAPSLRHSEDAAADDLVTFNATQPGMSVLVYSDHPSDTDVNSNGAVFEIVRTFRYNDPASGRYAAGETCPIGDEIESPEHQQPDRPGYALFELAYFDGSGPDAAYDRSGRNGHLFAVNRFTPGSAFGAPMAVAWYQQSPTHPSHYWPGEAAEYDCDWPTGAPEIVIASQKGSDLEGSPLNDAVFVDKRIYDQPDPALPGFNPNDEHALLAPSQDGTGFNALFAMRSDFGDIGDASQPYSLLKYRLATGLNAGQWAFEVFRVSAFNAEFPDLEFPQTGQLPIEAGAAIAAPYPLRLFAACPQVSATARPGICDPNASTKGTCATEDSEEEFFQDYKGGSWAKAAGNITARYYYPLQQGFYFDDRDTSTVVGDCVPWMDELPGTDPGLPIDVVYHVTWPNDAPLLAVGETLLEPKNGLPDIFNQLAVEIIFDQSDPDFSDATTSLAQIIDPLNPRSVDLAALPGEIATRDDGTVKRLVSRSDGTEKVTFDLQQRLSYNPNTGQLSFAGLFDAREAGDPLLLLNVMTDRERSRIKNLVASCGSATAFCDAVDELFFLTRNPQQIDLDPDGDGAADDPAGDKPDGTPEEPDEPSDALLIGLQDEMGEDTDGDGVPDPDGVPEPVQAVGFQPALTAGFSSDTGFLTLAFNNDEALNPLPVSVQVIRVGCNTVDGAESPYVGVVKQVAAESAFDEQLTLRHGGDFGGYADRFDFKWWSHPSEGGTPPTYLPEEFPADPGPPGGWSQLNMGNEEGAIDHTIAGADIRTLSDNWFFVQYTGLPACGNDVAYSIVAGDPAATAEDPGPKLGEGWIKRVVDGLNPFETRVTDFHTAPTQTFTSMLIALGERYEGDIAFNPEADAINQVGMIEAYETVLQRAMTLSIDSAPPVDYGPANDALLFITSRLADFYMLIGNEAAADASDPMIGFGTDSGVYGSLAPTIFSFQNQLPSLLEEETVLLRGRDDAAAGVAANPVYNRLFWNFTTGDGEVAYAQGYNISDQDQTRLGNPGLDGVIDEFDARIMYPQGHGDAWGHYLMAIKMYYRLLRHPSYSWLARAEAINVAGTALTVDFLDERKFAAAAAARARTGAQLVDLAYRQFYVDDPAGQWQGYRDPEPERAWGVSGWGRRAGQGAYFDWVTGNALLPERDEDPAHQGIAKVDRSTVRELDEIRSHFADVQSRMDQADQGLNPIGLAKGVVPFDIDPARFTSPILRESHFEQIYDRALTALTSAVAAYDHANQLTELLRRTQDSIDDFTRNALDQERDFRNRLLEIFGYPYSGDIGPGQQYPAGYEGPDTVHFMWIDETALTGSRETPVEIINAQFQSLPGNIDFFGFDSTELQCERDGDCSLQDQDEEPLDVELAVVDRTRSTAFPGLVKPPEVTGARRATGDAQDRLSDVLVAINSHQQAIAEYDNLVADVKDQVEILKANFDLTKDRIEIFREQRNAITSMNSTLAVLDRASETAKATAGGIDQLFEGIGDCIPSNTVFGFTNGGDLLSGVRCALTQSGDGLALGLTLSAVALDTAALGIEVAKEDVGLSSAIDVQVEEDRFEVLQQVKVLEALIREEPLRRLELNQRREIIDQNLGDLARALAKGQRTLEELVNFRRNAAADVQVQRYQDMAFRIFRNDALQKYQAAFDLAARYVFLAAAAYDYETNLLGSDQNAGQAFLTDIVRERSLGQMLDGQPVSGSGLADVMARLAANFAVLKGQLGLNNPQQETIRFSLREEKFRLMAEDDALPGTAPEWRQLLSAQRVDDLWDVAEFRRFARPFAPESSGPQPGLVIPFSTTVTFAENFFGWPLGPGDSAYDPTNFATRIHTAGVWFEGYDQLPLSATPRVYLIPVGADVLRSPTADDFSTREWAVVDQKIPVPLPISSQDLGDPEWIPRFDSVVGGFSEIRKFSSFRAYEFTEPLDDSEVAPDTRLIGRSVWNTKWLLIIPGGTLLADADEALDTFIDGAAGDGAGVSDIKILFQTYGYSGN